MATIQTLCTKCASEMGHNYKVKSVPRATTKQKSHCENCGLRSNLSQYLVQKKK